MNHIPPKIKPMTRRHRAAAFTLVEVLVVLVLLSILSGMVLTAVQGVTTSARMARTRSIIATVDSVIQEQYDSYKYRPFPVVIPDSGGYLGATENTLSHEILPSEAARVRLIMTRDLQRMELPDKVSDVRQATNRLRATMPTVIRGMADRVIEDQTTGELSLARAAAGDLSQRSQFTVNWYTGSPALTNNDRGHWPPRFSAYLRRTAASDGSGNIRWTPQHQGAECLYLILATTFSGGVSAIESIPASNIADTDGDGVPEILDGWGRPLGFIRWPIGYADPMIQTTVPDEFDPYRSDFGFLLSNVTAPYVVRPLVISAGADGEFGITFSPRQANMMDEDSVLIAAGSAEEANYATHTWPINATWMGPEAAGRLPASYGYPDPFLRQFIAGAGETYLLPGQGLLGPSANSYRADNISNFQLEATE